MSIMVNVVLVILCIVLGVWLFRKIGRLERPGNVKRFAVYGARRGNLYEENAPKRKSLFEYLEAIKSKNVPASHISLTNFYFSTANVAGLFYQEDLGDVTDGVFSPEAARLAAVGGARAFVFDIWPDLRPGANFAPILQVVEEGSNWRRISLNSLPFLTAVKEIIDTIMVKGLRNQSDTSKDVAIFYLRFRGAPRVETYAGVAGVLRSLMEQYRLDNSFSARRGQTRLFRTPITEFFGKILIGSNVTAVGSPLEDYINFSGSDKKTNGIRLEWNYGDLGSQTEEMKREAVDHIRQNLAVVAPVPENAVAQSNTSIWEFGHSLGVHMVGINFFRPSEMLTKYMAPENFGIYSYKIKPVNLRYVIETLPDPKVPNDPRWSPDGDRNNAGKPSIPEQIRGV